MNFKIFLSLLSGTSKIKPLENDVQFHSWCNSVGIEINSAQLATTSLSIAGRGVFATDDLEEGTTIIKIPGHCVLAPKVAEAYFPSLAKHLQLQNRQSKKWYNRFFRKGLEREPEAWQAELTAYALESVKSEHPWAFWIKQWKRDDPMLQLYLEGVSSMDEDRISNVAIELQSMLPELSLLYIQAAIQIRLQEFEEHLNTYFHHIITDDDGTKEDLARMYAVLSSRALDLGDGIVGVVPMYDMINHSLEPNLGLVFDGESFELSALRQISEGEELFLCYNEIDDIEKNGWDEMNSLWSLIQWGIPISTKEAIKQLNDIAIKKTEATTITNQ